MPTTLSTSASAASSPALRRTLGPMHLIAIGIGAIIGAGIFVVTGQAAALHAGPAVVISFALAGVGCLFAGLCYAEYASMIPIAGSAYTYTYATLGRLPAWIIGWNLVLEYLVASAAVAAGWSGYFTALTEQFGIPIPELFRSAPIAVDRHGELVMTGAAFNLPAAALVGALTLVLVRGVDVSVRFNVVMVAIKIALVLLVIAAGLPFVTENHHTPFIPPNEGTFGEFGWSGVFRATGMIFFAYIGFDAVSVLAQEARNPQRHVPIGILGSLFICTAMYMLVAYVVTGIAPYTSLNVANPVSFAVTQADASIAWLAPIIDSGAVVGLASVVLVLLLAQSRIFYSMARDGLLPPLYCEVHPRFRTPHRGTIANGCVSMLLAGSLPLQVLGELISIGTLAAFAFVCSGVLILRVRAPHIVRPFRAPLIWAVAPLGTVTCILMMVFLPLDTWIRLVIWTGIGLAIYFSYSIKHARAPQWSISLGADTPSAASLAAHPSSRPATAD